MQIILLGLLGALAIFIAALMGTAIGALGGALVGLVFDDSMRLLSQALGIEAKPYQLGAIFGFVGSFFRSSLSVERK